MEIRDEAYIDYEAGMKYKDIAEKYGVALSTVKSWASRHWNTKKAATLKGNATTKKDAASKQSATAKKAAKGKRGAPKGNRNAVGSKGGKGGPKGNSYALKHGGYSAIYWDTIDDEEKELIETMPDDEEFLLIQQLQLLSIRERRLMRAIKLQMGKKGDLYVESVVSSAEKKKFDNEEDEKLYREVRQEKIKEGKISYLYEKNNVVTSTQSTVNSITRLEAELTRVQAQKTKCIQMLNEMHKSAAAAAVEENKEDDGGSEQVMFYIPDNNR